MIIPTEIIDLVSGLKSQGYTRGSIIRAVKRKTKDKELAINYVDAILSARKSATTAHQKELKANPLKASDEAKSAFLSSFVTSIASFAIGGAVSWISYSAAQPGGTYIVASGLFIVGSIALLIALYRLIQWAYHSIRAKIQDKNVAETTASPSVPANGAVSPEHNQMKHNRRSWNDLE